MTTVTTSDFELSGRRPSGLDSPGLRDGIWAILRRSEGHIHGEAAGHAGGGMTNGGSGGSPSSGSGVTCTAVPVDVEGKQAVWIFTEFETDESLKNLRDWLIPENWPDWGGEMFKEMRPIGSVDVRPSKSNAQQTHSRYLEVVEIGGHRLETELRCEFKSTQDVGGRQLRHGPQHRGHAPGRPRLSHGGRRGRPTPREGPQGRRVHRYAAQHRRNGSLSGVEQLGAARGESGRGPGCRRLGEPDSRLGRRLGSQQSPGPPRAPQRSPAAWPSSGSSNVTDCVGFYAPFTVDVTERVWSGKYGRVDAANDTSRLFQRLARDWSRAWQAGMDNVSTWAEVTVRPTAGADPGDSARTTEHTTLMVKARSDKAQVSISDLTRIGRTQATIKASEITITPAVIQSAGHAYVTIQAETSRVPCGLYEGALVAGAGGKQAPALFYVSHAQPAQP